MKGGNSTFYDLIYRYMPKTGMRWEYLEFERDAVRGAKLIDIGCGDGTFLAHAKTLGCDIKGIDFNPTLGEQGKSVGINIEHVDVDGLDSYLSARGEFDIYTLWHVLEHLDDPLEVLRTIHRNSKQDSILVLAVPSNLFYMSCRSSRPITDYPPHHLTRWNKVALETIALRSGWLLDKHCHEPLGQGLKLYGLRFVKSIISNRNLFEEVKNLVSCGRFSGKSFSPIYDPLLNTLIVKVLGRLFYYFLLCLTQNGYTGMSQYAKLKKDGSNRIPAIG